MSRPRPHNNLDELQRKYALQVRTAQSSPTKPTTPQTGSAKGKFKPAKPIPAPATTIGSGKNKLPPLKFPLPADSSVSYVDASSMKCLPDNASTSSVPSKRLSSQCSEDRFPSPPPKRREIDHLLEEATFPFSDPEGKGKACAREPSPPPLFLPSQPPQLSPSIRVTFEALAPDTGLHKKSEDELWGVVHTAEDLRQACNELIVAAHSTQEPKDLELLTVMSEFLDRRAIAGRGQLKTV